MDHRQRYNEEEEARSRGRQGDDSRYADRSWRDQGDGRYSSSPRSDREDRYDEPYGNPGREDPRWSNGRIYTDSRYGGDGRSVSGGPSRFGSDDRSERYGGDGQSSGRAESRVGNGRGRERDIERWEGEGGSGTQHQSQWNSPSSSHYGYGGRTQGWGSSMGSSFGNQSGSQYGGQQGGSQFGGGRSSGQQEPEGGQPNYSGRGPKDYQRSDERIREEISDRLTDDHRIDATEISIQVSSGQVTLSGTVMDRDQKRQAEDMAERISGVREVTNNIRVSRQQDEQQGQQSASSRSGSSGSSTSGSSQPGTGKGRTSNM